MAHDPSAFIQEFFRGRDDAFGLDVDNGWLAAQNVNFSVATGIPFRIRFKCRETAGGTDSTPFKPQVRRNAGAFVACNIAPDTGVAPAGVIVLSSQYANRAAINTERLTNTSTFIAGEGMESTVNSNSYTLTSEETEFEFCFMILGFHDGPAQNVVDDTLEFRLVEDDNTVFAGAYTNPVVTVSAETPGYIGATFIEHPHVIGPFVDGNGNIYGFIEHSAADNNVVAIKSTDDGLTWREMDGSNRPSTQDFEGASVFQDGDTLHILQVQSEVNYHTFRMSDHASADTWDITDEVVDGTYTASSIQVGSIFARGDGTVVAFYVEDASPHRIRYRIRNGTWGSQLNFDGEATNEFISPFGVLGESDTIWIVYKDDTNGILYINDLSSGDSVGSRQSLATGLPTSGSSADILQLEPVYYDDEGVEVITAIYKKVGTNAVLFERAVKDGAAPDSETQVSTTTVNSAEGGNAMAIATAHVKDKHIWVFLTEGSANDIWRTDNDDEAGWSTDVEEQDGVVAHWISGRVISGRQQF